MKLEDAIKTIQEHIKNDPHYRLSWEANIAMCYKDEVVNYRKGIRKKYLNNNDRHIIANNAAAKFLDLFIS
jgi:hypothetical protein